MFNLSPGWKATQMEQSWKTSVPIYLMIAFDLPKWAIKASDKQRRGFLWKDEEQAKMAAIVLWPF